MADREDTLCGCGYRQSLHASDPKVSTYCELAEARQEIERVRDSAGRIIGELRAEIADLKATLAEENRA